MKNRVYSNSKNFNTKLDFIKKSVVIFFVIILKISQAQTMFSDPSFNIQDDCVALTSGLNGTVSNVALQNDGKIIVSGGFTQFNGISVNNLVRLNSDGSFDSSFNIGTGFNGSVNFIKIQPDNKLLLGGNFTSFNGISANYIARLNPDGSMDDTFISGAGFNNFVHVIELQSDSKILVGGGFTSYNGVMANRIIRLNSDGSQDITFSTGSGFNQPVRTLAIQPDGKVLAGGEFTTYNGSASNRIVRLNSSGLIDGSFNISNGFNDWVFSIILQPTGEILVSGYFSSYAGSVANSIVRILPTGIKDNNFNSSFAWPWIFAMQLQDDGKIIVGGYGTIRRINDDGSPDNSFITGAGITTPYSVLSLFMQPDHKIIIGGNFMAYDGICRNRLARLTDCVSVNTIASISACNSYTWIDGVTYTSSNNSATYTYAGEASNGCDSIVTLNLEINNSALATDVHTACNSFTWIDGITYTSSNNTATYTIVGGAANGCDSLVSLNLSINNVSDITTSTSDLTISANNLGASYQWLDCNNNFAVINGENGPSFTANANGTYAVEITEFGCIDTSACVAISVLANEVNYFRKIPIVYTSQLDGKFTIDLGSNYENIQVSIIDITGKLIQYQSNIQSQILNLSLLNPPGIYIISLTYGAQRAIIKAIIQ
jgi:uncharacterized delta-60 repeat protein